MPEATHNNPKFRELIAKLKEIFQIDRPDLDFGIYRILNARADEISDYLEHRLPQKVKEALRQGTAAQQQEAQAKLDAAVQSVRELGMDPEASPKVQELREQLALYDTGTSEHENQVFSHLLTFFSRYYDQGDFISQRRYKGDTYAIPYAGEEVMLHWANKDQYYTKSGENFSNYAFKLPEEAQGKAGRTVHFRLVAADTAKDNRKDNDAARCFMLATRRTVTRTDEEGEDYEEEILPIEETTGPDGSAELIIRFDYAAQPKGSKQAELVAQAVQTILADERVAARWLALGQRQPTDANPTRTLLEKQLTDYTTKNTADYFIHKDLGGFLRRELDFYVKTEVMHLDDVQNAEVFADIEKQLRMIQCLRAIALELIAFLAQLEDFQKKLWLKKKFVVSADYCVTLDRVPEALYPEIAANEAQWQQWKDLAVWDGKARDDLKNHPYWMMDTSLFPLSFKHNLLQRLQNLDAQTDGLLIHSDNFQALNFLQKIYQESIGCIYIDPPYNTGLINDFAYKDSYRHSSWLSMMDSRSALARKMSNNYGGIFISTDDGEYANIRQALAKTWGDTNFVADITWNSRKSVSSDALISISTNHTTFFSAKKTLLDERKHRFRLPQGEEGFSNPDDDPRGPWKLDPMDAPNVRENLSYTITNPETGQSFSPPGGRCWRFEEDQTEQLLSEGRIVFGRTGTARPMYKRFLSEAKERGKTPTTLWDDVKTTTEATKVLLAQFGNSVSRSLIDELKPKPSELVERCVTLLTEDSGWVLDYFSGSGTTASAVISLNREQNSSNRRYILVEQGEYFDTVLKPRIQKVVYSADWKGGKPTAPETGISHCFKVLKLESYEDALNNLELRLSQSQQGLLDGLEQPVHDDYLLHYLMDVESRGSLLSVADFNKPFDYELKVAVDSAGAWEKRRVDLVETFNYLIGLTVQHIDAQIARGFLTVTGTLPGGEKCLVLWRDCETLDYEGISRVCDKLAINPADSEFDVVYINGDHNIPAVLQQTEDEGGVTRRLKLRQIEPEFLERMFSVEDV